ncbi:hypothetical protein WK53_08580 [Burkholderia ubonensis]|uniref:Uncharacterized protein n=1 Tax=Burkholderia ubonensis TaxID=101571 RepID=A0AAW3NAX7_9BURK|nr:hypothetical protein WK53_08580 [Burkholderia ubonensis]
MTITLIMFGKRGVVMKLGDLLKASGVVIGSTVVSRGTHALPLSASNPVLPQYDTMLGQLARATALTAERLIYTWTQSFPFTTGMPMAVGTPVPASELPAIDWLFKAGLMEATLLVNRLTSAPSAAPSLADQFIKDLRQLATIQTQLAQSNQTFQHWMNNPLAVVDSGAMQTTLLSIPTQLGQIETHAFTAFNAVIRAQQSHQCDNLSVYNVEFCTIPLPDIASKLRDDDFFVNMRLAGANLTLLRQVMVLPSKLALNNGRHQNVTGSNDSLKRHRIFRIITRRETRFCPSDAETGLASVIFNMCGPLDRNHQVRQLDFRHHLDLRALDCHTRLHQFALHFVAHVFACIARIAERLLSLLVKQDAGLRHIRFVGRCAHHAMYHPFGVDTGMGLHPEMLFTSLLSLMHLRITTLVGVLGRRRHFDDRRNEQHALQPIIWQTVPLLQEGNSKHSLQTYRRRRTHPLGSMAQSPPATATAARAPPSRPGNAGAWLRAFHFRIAHLPLHRRGCAPRPVLLLQLPLLRAMIAELNKSVWVALYKKATMVDLVASVTRECNERK